MHQYFSRFESGRFLFQNNLERSKGADENPSLKVQTEIKALDEQITEKQRVKAKMIEVAKDNCLTFYHLGKEVELADVNLDKIRHWCFGELHQERQDDTENLQLARLLNDYYKEYHFKGFYEALLPAISQTQKKKIDDYKDKGKTSVELEFDMDDLKDGLLFFSELTFVKSYSKWDSFFKYYNRLINEFGESKFEINITDILKENGDLNKDNPKFAEDFYATILLRNEGILQILNNKTENQINIVHGGAAHFNSDSRIYDRKDVIICRPPFVNEHFDQIQNDMGISFPNFLEALEKSYKEMGSKKELYRYEEWKNKIFSKYGSPFAK